MGEAGEFWLWWLALMATATTGCLCLHYSSYMTLMQCGFPAQGLIFKDDEATNTNRQN